MLFADLTENEQATARARFLDAGAADGYVYQFDLEGVMLYRTKPDNSAAMQEVARMLATEAAISDLQCHTMRDSEGWFNLDSMDADDVYWVYRAVLYLHLVGMIERHPSKPRRIRIKGVPA